MNIGIVIGINAVLIVFLWLNAYKAGQRSVRIELKRFFVETVGKQSIELLEYLKESSTTLTEERAKEIFERNAQIMGCNKIIREITEIL